MHLTPDGGDYLARAVFKLIDTQCRVHEQAVTGQTKQAIQTQGSTLVGPGNPTSSTVPSPSSTSTTLTTSTTFKLVVPPVNNSPSAGGGSGLQSPTG